MEGRDWNLFFKTNNKFGYFFLSLISCCGWDFDFIGFGERLVNAIFVLF
jgi:hypothetical protein